MFLTKINLTNLHINPIILQHQSPFLLRAYKHENIEIIDVTFLYAIYCLVFLFMHEH